MGLEVFLAATFVVALGSIVQAVSAVGAGFLIVPLIALIDLSLLPGALVFASLSLSGVMALREREHIDFNCVPAILLGLIPGSLGGGYLLSMTSFDRLGMVFGTVILAAVGITASGFRVPLLRASAFIVGIMSGVMGGSTGIGAPMLALLYQDQSGPRARSTLALLYAGGAIIIVIMLVLVGRFGISDAIAGFLLMPGFLLGYLLSQRLTVRLDRGGTRAAVLAVSAVAAVSLMLRSL